MFTGISDRWVTLLTGDTEKIISCAIFHNCFISLLLIVVHVVDLYCDIMVKCNVKTGDLV